MVEGYLGRDVIENLEKEAYFLPTSSMYDTSIKCLTGDEVRVDEPVTVAARMLVLWL
jgi:hypothetical protein